MIEVTDYKNTIDKNHCLWFCVDTPGLKGQEFTPHIDEILYSELQAGNIIDYDSDTILIDSGYEGQYIQAIDELKEPPTKELELTWDEWVEDFFDNEVIKRFLEPVINPK